MEIVGLWVGSVGDSFSTVCPTPVESASGRSEKPLRNSRNIRNSRQSSPQSQPPTQQAQQVPATTVLRPPRAPSPCEATPF
ncbi:hypothetical protein ACLKA6_014384 [Drosophila palustris]